MQCDAAHARTMYVRATGFAREGERRLTPSGQIAKRQSSANDKVVPSESIIHCVVISSFNLRRLDPPNHPLHKRSTRETAHLRIPQNVKVLILARQRNHSFDHSSFTDPKRFMPALPFGLRVGARIPVRRRRTLLNEVQHTGEEWWRRERALCCRCRRVQRRRGDGLANVLGVEGERFQKH